MKDIIIGVISSLVATVIWVIIDYVVKSIKARNRVALLLDLLYDSSDSFDSAMVSENEQLAEIQSEYIIKYCIEIFDSIRFLTYIGNKRKLIYTILYNLYYTITYYKRIYVGSSKEEEQKEKLLRFKRKYYFMVSLKDDSGSEERSFLMVSVALLQEIVQSNSVSGALNRNLYVWDNTNNKYDVYLNLININNMKSDSLIKKYDIRKNLFTTSEYKEYLKKKLKHGTDCEVIKNGMDN